MAGPIKRPVGTFTGEQIKLHTEKFKKEFEDGTPINSFNLVKVGGKLFFERRGKDASGNCHLWSTRAKFTQSGDIVLVGLQIDTCTGNPCSSCSTYIDTRSHQTGCRCNDTTGTGHSCNHTQTTIGAVVGNLHGVFLAEH